MKKIILILSIIFSSLICSGCFNYRELNDLAIISAIGIEKTEDKEDYLVSAQIVNIKKTGSEAGNEGISKVVTYKGKGKDIDSAIKRIANESSKDIFLAHLKLLIIDDDVIKNELTNVIDFFARDTESKMNFYVVTSTTDKPIDILETLTPLDSLPSQDIYNSLDISEELMGNANVMTFEELLDILLQKGINPVYTDLKIKGEKNKNENTDSLKESAPKSVVSINNLVSFDNNGGITKLNEDESIGYSFIKNRIKKPVVTGKCEDENNYFSVEILKSKSKIESQIKNDTININIKATGTVGEINCNNNLDDIKTRKMINSVTSKEIKKKVLKTINLSKKTKNDFIGIGNYIYKNEKDYFDFKNKDWDRDGIEKMKIKVKIKLEIIKEGNLEKNIHGSDTNEK